MTVVDKNEIRKIKRDVHSCRLCEGLDETGALCIDQKEIGLDYDDYSPKTFPINILFVAESPPKPGNGFFYDANYQNLPFRERLFTILNGAELLSVLTLDGFRNKGYYLADSINCRWDKGLRNYLLVSVFRNCSTFLVRQIEIFRPKFIVAIGNSAQKTIHCEVVQEAIQNAKIPDDNIVEMSCIVVASNETDEDRVAHLQPITSFCRSRQG
jgi:hypothetical protein